MGILWKVIDIINIGIKRILLLRRIFVLKDIMNKKVSSWCFRFNCGSWRQSYLLPAYIRQQLTLTIRELLQSFQGLHRIFEGLQRGCWRIINPI